MVRFPLTAMVLAASRDVVMIGAGPTSLFLANILLQQDPTVNIQVLEKNSRDGTPDDGAFGFGIGIRHEKAMEQIPGMWEELKDVSAPLESGLLRMIRRNDLCSKLRSRLENTYPTRCKILYETECENIDFKQNLVSLKKGSGISYDLLVGADGANSMVREAIRKDDAEYHEEHYFRPICWKALRLPDQNGKVAPGAFKTISGAGFKTGGMLPRHPEGHTVLAFWDNLEMQNPEGVHDEKELANAITTALQAKKSFLKKMTWNNISKQKTQEKLQIKFDDVELKRFLKDRARREHILKLNKYHHNGNVALVGDSAHSMYSLLGQGAACGFLTASMLASSLGKERSISTALENYSNDAVPEANAIVDLNLISHALEGGLLIKLATLPIILISALRGSVLFREVVGTTKPYQEILKKNRFLIWICKQVWKKKRVSMPITTNH
ncbi:MAG: kynurenine 3-monooxygenase [Bacillariaceae sp.]|jgi:kynurenine 3-monooxygenase